MGPLKGIKVIDMSRYISGPYCSMLLGDMGAEVIKVEKPGIGEDSRTMGPFAGNVSLYFTQYNKNKKSIALNTRSEEGKKILFELIKGADVLVENFRPGTLEKMGLTKEKIQELNPGLVVTSISGFGQTSPYRNRVAFDCIAQAMSGLMSLTGEEDGQPLLTGTWIVDFVTAVYAAFGTVCALYNRKSGGSGQSIDVALLDCMVSLLATTIPLYTTSGVIEHRWSNRDKVTAPANAFPAKDGSIYIHAGTQPLFTRMTQVMGQPELMKDERFDTVAHRMANIEAIEALVGEWTKTHTVKEMDQMLAEAGIPAAPINSIADVVHNEQVLERKDFEYMEYPGAGEISINGITLKMSETPGEITLRPPLLGEHTEEILKGTLGYSDEKIQELKNGGII